MEKKEKVLVAMSGGVDSSTAAKIITVGGYDAVGCTLLLTGGLPGCTPSVDVADARAICDTLGIEHKAVDLSDRFGKDVVDYFARTYLEGKTPNPCIECNRKIKFGALIEIADSLGCDKIATGHYARIKKSGDRYLLMKSADEKKDQTYMLWTLSQAQLSRVLFPLGDIKKSDVRGIAKAAEFENAVKKDSQDICFIPDGDYVGFIEKYAGYSLVPGDYIDETGKVLGKHRDMLCYTIGQRKGLGIALGRPMFVTDKSAKNNTVTLADSDRLFKKSLDAENVNLIAAASLSPGTRVYAKTRYHQPEAPATVTEAGDGRIHLEFDSPVRAICPGQSVVMYDGDIVIGGGIIK